MQDCVSWFIETKAQLVTTPATLPSFTIKPTVGEARMRDFVILGSSIVTPSSSSVPSLPQHRHSIKPPRSSNLTPSPLSPSNISSTLNRYPPQHAKQLQHFEITVLDPLLFDSPLNPELLATAVVAGIRAKKVRTVIDTLNKVQQELADGISLSVHFDAPAMDIIGKECSWMVQCGHIEEAVELMEVLSRFQLSVRHLVQPSGIIKQCVLSRNPNLAMRYACLLPHARILFCNIICEFGKRRDLVSALKAYDASKKNLNSPNMYIYRAIIDVCGLCGDCMKSRYIYEDLRSQKITPNIYVFNSLMNVNAHDLSYTLNLYKNMQVFADAKMSQMALKIKQDMLSAGVSLNTVAWSSLINACAHAGLVEQAIQLFEEMLLAGCEPNTQCFNIILHACVEACQYDRAFRFFHYWKGNKMLGSFGEGYNSKLEQGDRHTATTVPNGISDSHILSFTKRFPFTPTTTTYNILLKACGTDYYRAKALINEMKTVGLSPNHISWSILIDICGASENVEGAVEILKTMSDDGIRLDVVAYTTAIKVCVESKDFKQALSLYGEMKSYEIHPNLVTYNTFLKARSKYGSLHEVQQCLAIYQDMRKAGYKPNDYYLEELIEEWCEGVIQDNTGNQVEFSSSNKSELERPESLLLEKIASHLLKRVADILAIDVRELTKVEARLVVLAVLRMIKENYGLGHSVNDDILIIIGATKADETLGKHILEVQESTMKLLRNELGLEVLPARTRFALSDTAKLENHNLSNLSIKAQPGENTLPTTMGFHTRRPAVLHRLKVTKKSLYHWLHRKVSVE